MPRKRHRSAAIKKVLILLGLLLLALGLVLALPNAESQAGDHGGLCLPHAEMTSLLAARFQERSVALGPTGPGGLVELFKGPGGRTWTLTITLPDGRSCLMASGSDWREEPRKMLKAGP